MIHKLHLAVIVYDYCEGSSSKRAAGFQVDKSTLLYIYAVSYFNYIYSISIYMLFLLVLIASNYKRMIKEQQR